ncbi:hypothetical protein [Sporanaerobacter sp. PP17-6a]|uniref:hypothetical protein n=1 Tax=Sporanaerobacter sp. PP17-6a TaxID=1891289 RepID=UPI0008A05872|nr:hypothetical protein [Sporanaerobacter sp. PP17-6a]SCL88034.1 hypothetical protein PP176A_1448 [Sporanaerobacter sp. PP17-6a]
MFDLEQINKRYFDLKLKVEDDNGAMKNIQLQIKPPKIKTLKKVIALSAVKDEEAIDDLADAVKMILANNKSNYKVTDKIVDNLNIDQLNTILVAYFQWLSIEQKNPN